MTKFRYKESLLLIGLLILIVYLLTDRNKDLSENINTKANLQANSQVLLNRLNVENKFIWDVGIISKEESQEFLENSIHKKHIFFVYDSIGCAKCYNFHKNKLLLEKDQKNLVVLDYGRLEFLKKDFRNKKFLKAKTNNANYKQLILIVNSDGRILYSDFPQYENLEYSEKFYNAYLN